MLFDSSMKDKFGSLALSQPILNAQYILPEHGDWWGENSVNHEPIWYFSYLIIFFVQRLNTGIGIENANQ